jgi:hypothetical protein
MRAQMNDGCGDRVPASTRAQTRSTPAPLTGTTRDYGHHSIIRQDEPLTPPQPPSPAHTRTTTLFSPWTRSHPVQTRASCGLGSVRVPARRGQGGTPACTRGP